jgi:hypothetical protein
MRPRTGLSGLSSGDSKRSTLIRSWAAYLVGCIRGRHTAQLPEILAGRPRGGAVSAGGAAGRARHAPDALTSLTVTRTVLAAVAGSCRFEATSLRYYAVSSHVRQRCHEHAVCLGGPGTNRSRGVRATGQVAEVMHDRPEGEGNPIARGVAGAGMTQSLQWGGARRGATDEGGITVDFA